MTGWVRESLHFDRPVSPLFASLFVPAIERGYRLAAERAGVAPLKLRVQDGHVYASEGGASPPTAPDDRMLGAKVDEWERDLVPEAWRALGELRASARSPARRLAGELARAPDLLARLYDIHYGIAFETKGGAATVAGALARRGDEQAALTTEMLVAPCPGLQRDVDAWLAASSAASLDELRAAPLWAKVEDRPAWIDVAAPTWREEPERTLRAARAADAPAFDAGTRRALAQREQAEAVALARFPIEMHAAVRSGLASLRRAKSVAQTVNFLAGELAIGASRRAYLRAGELLGVGPEVVFLDHDEIVAALRDATPAPRERLDARRAEAERGSRPVPEVQAERDLRGLAASPGRAEGVARVCATEDDIDALAKGEVLVVRALPPAWTTAASRASGIVAELGGMLSHAAVVAREMGVPAVVGVPGATARIRSGARVRVDGGAGEVELA